MRANQTRRRVRLSAAILLSAALVACGQGAPKAPEGEAHNAATADFERGPHRGRLLRDGDFALEITLYEEGPAPLFRLYAYQDGKPVDPKAVQVSIALSRLGPKVDRFTFAPEADYLTSPAIVHEPHSFDVSVAATHAGKAHKWAYASYEGRTTIAADAERGLADARARRVAVLRQFHLDQAALDRLTGRHAALASSNLNAERR